VRFAIRALVNGWSASISQPTNAGSHPRRRTAAGVINDVGAMV
jgi:hypothetical protein